MPPFPFEKDRALVVRTQKIDEIAPGNIGIDPAGRAQRKGLVGSPYPSFAADNTRQYSGFRKGAAPAATDQAGHVVEYVRLNLRDHLPQQIFLALPGPYDLGAIFRDPPLQAFGIAATIPPGGAASRREQFVTASLQRQFGRNRRTIEPFGEKLVGADQPAGPIGRGRLRPQKISNCRHAHNQSDKGTDHGNILHLPVEQPGRSHHRHNQQSRSYPDACLRLARTRVQQPAIDFSLTGHRQIFPRESC